MNNDDRAETAPSEAETETGIEAPSEEENRHILSGFQDWLHHHPHIRVLMALVGVVMVWRGVWALCDKVMFPDNPMLSYTTSIGLGLVLLLIDDFKLDEIH